MVPTPSATWLMEPVEAGEEGLEEVGNFVLEEILGIDIDASDEGSPSEGHDYDADYGDTSDELRLAADLTDHFLTTVDEASTESNVRRLLLTDDIYGTLDDAVTEPDATHVFDDVAGTVADIVTETEARPLHVAGTGFERGDLAADSLQFIHSHPAHTPEWTNFNEGDPSTGLLEVPSFLASDSVLGHAPNHEATRAFDDVVGTVNHFVTDAQAAAIVLPDLEGADTAIVADLIQLAGAAISADSFESMRSQPDSDPYAESLELLPLLVDSVSAYDPQDEPTQTYSVHLTEAGTPDFATTLEDASPSHSLSWLF